MIVTPRHFIDTVKHLQARQIWAQLRHRLCPPRGRVRHVTAPTDPQLRWAAGRTFLPPGAEPFDADALQAGRFRFVGDERALGWMPDWRQTVDAPLLWTYNLHYFEWLWALPFEAAKAVVEHWHATYPDDAAREGWAPYPTSLRIQTWCMYFFGLHADATMADADLSRLLHASLLRHGRHVSRNPETRLLGNHYLENAAALAFVGACFDDICAAELGARGLEILREQLPEQILPDGMHFERSPMYHLRVLHLLENLYRTDDDELRAVVEPHRDRMLDATQQLTHPDGDIALLNDSAFGIYPRASTFVPPYDDQIGAWALPEAGYYGWRRGADYLICDAGPVGPDYIPGHAHGDVFSFELSLAGARILVDSGTYGYEDDAMRRYCRSTAAHNTVSIEGADQCEFWGAFRVGRRPALHAVSFTPKHDGFELAGEHDGFVPLSRCIHRRTFDWSDDGELTVTDDIGADNAVRAQAFYHFHPACTLTSISEHEARFSTPIGDVVLESREGGRMSENEGYYCPRFGVRERNTVISIRTVGTRPRLVTRIRRA